MLQLIVYGVRIGTTQLCSKALIQIERSKRSTYNQAQFINYAMLCRATRICFTNHGTKSQHVTKVESDIRKIDNRCCYRRESELTVQTRNTCYQLQKIVLVFFFFLFRYYSFIRFMTIYYTQATFSDIHRLSRQDRTTNRHESRRETPT